MMDIVETAATGHLLKWYHDGQVLKLTTFLVILAFILLLDRWLRRRETPLSVVTYLGLTVVSWIVAAVLSIDDGAVARWFSIDFEVFSVHDSAGNFFGYLVSPVSSFLLAYSTFEFSKIREKVKKGEHFVCLLKQASLTIVCLFSVLQLLVSLRFWWTDSNLAIAGNWVRSFDALASMVAIAAFASGVIYSFRKYNNVYLALLGIVVLGSMFVRQVANAFMGIRDDGLMLAWSIADNIGFGLILAALFMAWGLSEDARLSFVGYPRSVGVFSLCFDLRGSTKWITREEEDKAQVAEFMNELRGWALAQFALHLPEVERPHMVKFLGDGYLFVWESTLGNGNADRSVGYARTIAENFYDFRVMLVEKKGFVRTVPEGLGVGLDFGEALRLTHASGSHDYIGKCISYSSKLQSEARPNGGVVITEKMFNHVDNRIQRDFTEIVSKSGVEARAWLRA